MSNFVLLPTPRHVEMRGDTILLPQNALIQLDSATLLFEAHTIQRALTEIGLHWQIVVGKNYQNVGLALSVNATIGRAESYTLQIANGQIKVEGADAAGVFYGVCTLKQLLQQLGSKLPALFIEDTPDFPARGVMLDVSRDRVPTMETVYQLVDKLASWKINQLQLYMEHSFAYQNHSEVWADASPFTAQEILELDGYCRQRHIELVPNQNSLGHMERWLQHPRYQHLAERPEGFEMHGRFRPASTLNPVDPASLELVFNLYDELLPHFSSRLFNVGGDEPWEFGTGKSKSVVDEKGSGRVYLDYLLALYKNVSGRGFQMQFWTDIIVKYPELVAELPRSMMIAMIWGYEANEPREEYCRMVSESSVPFYVCPGTSSWNSLIGRTDNAMQNLLNAATYGHRYGATGYLITDWGDNGHWQVLATSYLGFAYGAGLAWYTEGNHSIDLPRVLDLFAFQDKAGKMGKLAYEVGNLYQTVGGRNFNGQELAYLLQLPPQKVHAALEKFQADGTPISAESLRRAVQILNDNLNLLGQTDLHSQDADWIKAEYQQAMRLMRHSAKRVLWLLEEPIDMPDTLLKELENLVEQQKTLWLARSRPGGLVDSLRRFDSLFEGYQ